MVLFFVGILPALRNLRVRVASDAGTPGIAYADDIAMAPRVIIDTSISEYLPLRTDLAAVGTQLATGKIFALPPANHGVSSRELELLAGAGIGMTPSDGLVVVGVRVGSASFVVDYMRRRPTELGMSTVARHAAAMEDTQTTALILSMSLARRTGFLERNVDPGLGVDAWRQADAISTWTMEQVL